MEKPQASKSSIRGTFRVLQALAALLVVFLVVQGGVLSRVCQNGTGTTRGLMSEGLPSLKLMATLQENLALYRLHSYELMFVQEDQRAAKARALDELGARNSTVISELKRLFPQGEGSERVAHLEGDLGKYVSAVRTVRSTLDSDFQKAMQMLDQEIPEHVRKLNASATEYKQFCERFAESRSNSTVAAFDSIRRAVLWLGSASLAFAFGVAVFVTIRARTINRTLSEAVLSLTSATDTAHESAQSIATSSQALAEGATQQAASVEETVSSITEITSMVKRNAEAAQEAKDLSGQTRLAADAGSTDMDEMNKSMAAMKSSSDEVAKIVKSIDELAFQTNILALNAAVEAARAGSAGAGFAVVADEVRNLAQRSAHAARETAQKIDEALKRTAQSVSVSVKVAANLQEIVSKARSVDNLVGQIAGASLQQAEGISLISRAITQIDEIAQRAASGAEECARAGEELNIQAASQQNSVEQLRELMGGKISAPTLVRSLPTRTDSAKSPTRSKARKQGRSVQTLVSKSRNESVVTVA